MIQEIIDAPLKEEIFTRLDAIAEKLGVAAEHLWAIFTNQAMFEGISALLLILVSAIASILAARFSIRRRSLLEDKNDRELALWCLSFSLIGLAVSAIMFLTMGVEIFTKIMNPEYYAWLEIKDIIR